MSRSPNETSARCGRGVMAANGITGRGAASQHLLPQAAPLPPKHTCNPQLAAGKTRHRLTHPRQRDAEPRLPTCSLQAPSCQSLPLPAAEPKAASHCMGTREEGTEASHKVKLFGNSFPARWGEGCSNPGALEQVAAFTLCLCELHRPLLSAHPASHPRLPEKNGTTWKVSVSQPK